MFCAAGQSSPVRPSDLVNQLSSSSTLSAMKSECVWEIEVMGRGEGEEIGKFECESTFCLRKNGRRKGGDEGGVRKKWGM